MTSKPQIKMTPAEQEVLSAYEQEVRQYSYMGGTSRKILHMFDPDVIVMLSPEEIYDEGLRQGLFKIGGSVSITRSRYLYSIRKFHEWILRKFEEGKHTDDWFEPEWMEAHAI